MRQAVLIKGKIGTGGTVFLGLAGLLGLMSGSAIAVCAAKPPAAPILMGIGLLLCLTACIKYAFNVASRVYLVLGAGGFRVRDRRGEVEYNDKDVEALAVDVEPVHRDGAITRLRRHATLQIGGNAGEVIRMDYAFPFGENADPLRELFARLQTMLLTQFRKCIAKGQQVTGEGWSLDDRGLSIESGETQARHLYGDLAAVSVVYHQVNVWERGQAEAALRVPLRTPNAWALASLLQERLPADTARDDAQVGDGLGRILFDRNKSWPLGVVIPAYCVALGVAAFGTYVLAEAGLQQRERGLIGIGVFLAVIGFLVAVVSYCNRVNLFRVHALGVTRSTTLGTRNIRYDNVGKFTWWAVRQFVNGLYTGTTLKIALEPLAGASGQKVRCTMSLDRSDEELDRLRDFIAGIIADRWLRAVQGGEPVPWTANTEFRAEGLYHRKGWRRTRELIPYGKLLRWQAADGCLYIYGPEGKTLVQEPCNQTNFFPGMMLLLIIMREGSLPLQQADSRIDQRGAPILGSAQIRCDSD